jgi:hypothetical protein
LEHPDGVRLADRLIDIGAILREVSEVNVFSVVIVDQFDTVFKNSHHAQPEKIHFDQVKIGAFIFIPLHRTTLL